MTIFIRKKLVLLIMLCAVVGIAWKKLDEYVDQQHIENLLQQDRYAELVAKQLQSDWQCLPDSEAAREQFMLKLMHRFAPDDYTQLERGIAWARDYRVKMLTGELTVEERDAAKASLIPMRMGQETFYTPPWTLESGRPTQYLTLADCILNRDTVCHSMAGIGIHENGLASMVYQIHGLRWVVTDEEWFKLARKEYWGLNNRDARFAELAELVRRDQSLRYEAEKQVAKMSADEVPLSQEAQAIQREYLKLACR